MLLPSLPPTLPPTHTHHPDDFQRRLPGPWAPDEPRSCKLTFIRKNSTAALAAGFKECLATDENKAKRAKKLRFAVGQRVECGVGGWEPGEVVSYSTATGACPRASQRPTRLSSTMAAWYLPPRMTRDLFARRNLRSTSRAAAAAAADVVNRSARRGPEAKRAPFC